MTSDPLRLVGTTIEQKYEVTHFVGEGGFSVVYRARHKVWDQDVALKIFKLNALGSEESRITLRDAFVNEGKLMAQLSAKSPAIVQARDIGSLQGARGEWNPFMVLEWLEGESLDAAFDAQRRGHIEPWTLEQTVHILDSAASALALAHRHNVVHRDLKPGNLFLVRNNAGDHEITKVLDFGVAKVMLEHLDTDEALKQTSAQLNAFTPRYGAPEQFSRSYGATGPWTDVFAFALIVLEAARRGAPAFEGSEFLELATQSTNVNVRPTPRALGMEVSDEIEKVFARALEVSPEARFPDIGSFWRELRGAVFSGEQTWTPLGSSMHGFSPSASAVGQARVAAASTADLAAAAPATDPSGEAARASGGRGLNPLLGAAALAALGVAIWMFSSDSTPSKEAPTAAEASEVDADANVAAAAPTPPPPPPPPCPEGMALVPGGKFFMGSDDDKYPRWKPAHKTRLDPFCLDIHEVTAGQYKSCSDSGGCKRNRPEASWAPSPSAKPKAHARKEQVFSALCNIGVAGREQHPMNCVAWADANNFCEERGGRLPTEAEWEFAARGSDGRRFPWGDSPPDETHMNACGTECVQWHEANDLPPVPVMYERDDGFPGTAPVGSFPAGVTMFGMHDMVGNVFEWTADWYGAYEEAGAEVQNPAGPPEGDRRVVRGGAFNGGFTLWVDPAFRYSMPPTDRSHGVGFRCAMQPAKGSLATAADVPATPPAAPAG